MSDKYLRLLLAVINGVVGVAIVFIFAGRNVPLYIYVAVAAVSTLAMYIALACLRKLVQS